MSTATAALLRELLSYDPGTGKLTWLERTAAHFVEGRHSAAWQARQFNSAFAGSDAGSVGSDGYVRVWVCGRSLLAHRVAYALMMGQFPEAEMDHENGRLADNRWLNIRAVDRPTNAKNLPLRADNRTGTIGVGWYPKTRKWRVRINDAGRTVTVGSFASFERACAARSEAQRKLGFHLNHGRGPSI